MLKDSWQASLGRVLELINKQPSRLAIVGIGNELNGDDAAGVLIVRKLDPFLKVHPSIKLFEAGQTPENITGAVIRFKPDTILFMDAISIGAKPGTIHILDWERSEGFSASTHSLPLKLVAQYIQHEHACQIHLLGIQVEDTRMGVEVTPAVMKAINDVAACVTAATSASKPAV
jgi:hydrogenase 3 maturation protease